MTNNANFSVAFSTGKNVKDTRLKHKEFSLKELNELFSKPEVRGRLSFLEYHKAPKEIQVPQKDGPCFLPGAISGVGRRKESVKKLYAFVMDFDSGRVNAGIIKSKLREYLFFAHTSYSHSEACEKWRVVIPYHVPIPAEEHIHIYTHFNQIFDGELDAACKKPAQIYFLPSCPPEGEKFFKFIKNYEII